NAYHSVLSFFGISSPSKLMRDMVGRNIVLGMIEGINDMRGDADDAFESIMGIPSTKNMKFGMARINRGVSEAPINVTIEVKGNIMGTSLEKAARELSTEFQRLSNRGVKVGVK